MTKCYQKSFDFPRSNRRAVEASFNGGDISFDGGVLLLREADRRLGLSAAVAAAVSDPRRQASVDHDIESPVRQRLYALALGYEDLSDHDTLRRDVAMQTAVERGRSGNKGVGVELAHQAASGNSTNPRQCVFHSKPDSSVCFRPTSPPNSAGVEPQIEA